MNQKCGFVTILGEPNVGKSTLLNSLIGSKISIVSPKIQTTRTRIIGIVVENSTQMIIKDTPGIFAPHSRLEKAMVKAAWEGMTDSDCVVILVDCGHKNFEKAFRILHQAEEKMQSFVVVLNKIDTVEKEKLLQFSAYLNDHPKVKKVFMISALKGNGVQDLKDYLFSQMPCSPWYYPEDQLTDKSERFLAAEITREHLFRLLHKELPYHLTVEPERWEEFDNGSIKISQIIRVDRENHRKIILGEGGRTIKKIGETARRELQQILEKPIHLFLFVKVDEKWQEKRPYFTEQGLDFNA